MQKAEIITKLAAVAVTLAETTKAGESVAASPIYLALGMDLNGYQAIVAAGARLGWFTATSETVGLTDKGREAARELAPAFA